MKKILTALLMLCLLLSNSALALDYYMYIDNPAATFETLEEAHANGPVFLAQATGLDYVPDAALDTYPKGTTYVYRSPKLYTSLSAAFRMNTNILVYTDAQFTDKSEAEAYLKDMGLTDLVDTANGSIVLVTAIDPEKGFGEADQYAFYQLQSAMCNLGYFTTDEETETRYYAADNTYFGGLTYRYAIGIGDGATFLNNYVASTLDYVSRLGAILLINGEMSDLRDVAAPVPVYLVNPTDYTAENYMAANETDAWGYADGLQFFYNQAYPMQNVTIEMNDQVDLKELVPTIYNDVFLKYMRIPVNMSRLFTAGTTYRDYNWNQAPYSLAERVAWYTGKTTGGIVVTEHKEERFSDLMDSNGQYLQTWFECLPEEVLNNTAPAGTIPLILANHGGGDDPMQFVDEFGLLPIAESERVALVVPYHSDITFSVNIFMPALVRYMLETYPALDASRVYTTGYSMGGIAALASVYGAPDLFAATVSMAGFLLYQPTEEDTDNLNKYGMPMLGVISNYDDYWYDWGVGIAQRFQDMFTPFMIANGFEPIQYDFATYPMSGFKGDVYSHFVINGEYENNLWFFLNEDSVPMVGLNIMEGVPHGLYQEYGTLAWDYMKQFSRDPETKEIVFTPATK